MATTSSFRAMGKSAAVVTNGTQNTASSASVTATSLGLGSIPDQCRVFNASANTVYLSFSEAAQTAVVPTAGTPQYERPILPNSVEVFSLEFGGGKASVSVNTIAPVGASNTLILTFGEGL